MARSAMSLPRQLGRRSRRTAGAPDCVGRTPTMRATRQVLPPKPPGSSKFERPNDRGAPPSRRKTRTKLVEVAQPSPTTMRHQRPGVSPGLRPEVRRDRRNPGPTALFWNSDCWRPPGSAYRRPVGTARCQRSRHAVPSKAGCDGASAPVALRRISGRAVKECERAKCVCP